MQKKRNTVHLYQSCIIPITVPDVLRYGTINQVQCVHTRYSKYHMIHVQQYMDLACKTCVLCTVPGKTTMVAAACCSLGCRTYPPLVMLTRHQIGPTLFMTCGTCRLHHTLNKLPNKFASVPCNMLLFFIFIFFSVCGLHQMAAIPFFLEVAVTCRLIVVIVFLVIFAEPCQLILVFSTALHNLNFVCLLYSFFLPHRI